MTCRALILPPILVVAGLLCWGAGFVWFLHITAEPPNPPPAHVDGIVALTGGAGRVEAALRLLASGQGERLLVSGTGANTDLAALARLARIDVSALAPAITLGHYAASTQGNAVETAAWAAQNRVQSLIVVTAAWHMPRAMAELRQALPDVRLFAVPVEPLADADRPAADHSPSLRMRAEEYTKYLLVVAGLSPWFPHREAVTNTGSPLGAPSGAAG
jgi:uncharacterized SAM-binding protein YcdF (DUF218 family)